LSSDDAGRVPHDRPAEPADAAAVAERPAGRPGIPDGHGFHRCRCGRLREGDVDEAPRHRHDAVAAPQGVCRARSVAPKREGCRAGRAGSKGRRLMVPMRLYHEVRGCSLAVDIVARELGIPLDLIWVDVPRKLLPDGSNYYDVNP